jgi:hypothetical protein
MQAKAMYRIQQRLQWVGLTNGPPCAAEDSSSLSRLGLEGLLLFCILSAEDVDAVSISGLLPSWLSCLRRVSSCDGEWIWRGIVFKKEVFFFFFFSCQSLWSSSEEKSVLGEQGIHQFIYLDAIVG